MKKTLRDTFKNNYINFIIIILQHCYHVEGRKPVTCWPLAFTQRNCLWETRDGRTYLTVHRQGLPAARYSCETLHALSSCLSVTEWERHKTLVSCFLSSFCVKLPTAPIVLYFHSFGLNMFERKRNV